MRCDEPGAEREAEDRADQRKSAQNRPADVVAARAGSLVTHAELPRGDTASTRQPMSAGDFPDTSHPGPASQKRQDWRVGRFMSGRRISRRTIHFRKIALTLGIGRAAFRLQARAPPPRDLYQARPLRPFRGTALRCIGHMAELSSVSGWNSGAHPRRRRRVTKRAEKNGTNGPTDRRGTRPRAALRCRRPLVTGYR